MSLFELPQGLETLTGGSTRVDMTQMYPITGNVTQPSNQFVGTGAASGLSSFQFSESKQWWSPALSYFQMQVYVTKLAGPVTSPSTPARITSPVISDGVALADNWVATLFSQIKTRVNSRQLDIIDNVAIMDTALSYANCKNNFLKTFGSLTWIGQPFQTRLINTCANPVNERGAAVEVIFRPCVSLFDVKLLPPGAQFNFDFNWSPTAIGAFESAFGDIAANSTLPTTNDTAYYNISVQSFSFYKASITPSDALSLPPSGVIELSPAIINQYPQVAANQIKQNITLMPTVNRILVVAQDISTQTVKTPWTSTYPNGTTTTNTTVTCGVGTGFNPATSFAWKFSGLGAAPTDSPYAVSLTQMYLTIMELGLQMPQPVYNITNGVWDLARAYSDFCHITQGTIGGYEGSIPYGCSTTTAGVPISVVAASAAAPVFNAGDKDNDQAIVIASTDTTRTVALTQATTVTFSAGTCNHMARYGWSGSRPGPIFAFNILRPDGATVSSGSLNILTSAPVGSVTYSVIQSYSTAIELQLQGNGQYAYHLVDGI